MNILMDDNGFLEQNPAMVEMIEKVIVAALKEEKFPSNVEISITFTDNEGIQQINAEYRDIDQATDVLSFPQIEWLDEEIDVDEYINPDSGDIMLGDIVISTERAKEQAIEYGHSLQREIGFLTAHSMFHLLGYDHMEEEEEKIMIQKQESVLKQLGLIR